MRATATVDRYALLTRHFSSKDPDSPEMTTPVHSGWRPNTAYDRCPSSSASS